MSNSCFRLIVCAALSAVSCSAVHAQFDDPEGFSRQRTLKAVSVDQVVADLNHWLAGQQTDDATRRRALALLTADAETAKSDDVLGRLAAAVAVVDGRARELVRFCSGPRQHVILPEREWLSDEMVAPLVRNNMRLLYGRWLARERLYDEALAQLEPLQPADVVDPASLLFYQSIVHHQLLQREPSVRSIRSLLDDVADSPRRYTALVTLMEDDLKALEDDSLDHISRRMEDIQRRLDFGRTGQRVVKIENGVIDSLDKLIEEMEKQQQQQQSGGGGGNRIQSSNPAPDSVPIGGLGPGDVDRRNIGGEDDWGNLPPRERQKALQQIGKDFPSHYRDVIGQYFRKLATGNRPN